MCLFQFWFPQGICLGVRLLGHMVVLFLIFYEIYQQMKWIKKLWYIYTMEYYSAIKRNTFESVLMRWMNLEPVIQSEVSQKEKDKYHILMHIYGIHKNGTEEFIYWAAMEKQTQRIDLRTWGEGREGEMYGKSNIETYIAICKIDNQWEFAVCLRNLLAILIPACDSSSPEFQNVYSAQKLNKQGDNMKP